jgi:hypothetical protein
VNKTTVARQVATLQTLATEERKELVLSITLKDGSNVNICSKHFKATRWKPPEKKEFQKRKFYPGRFTITHGF